MAKRRNPFISRKLMSDLLDEFAFFGSSTFFALIVFVAAFLNNSQLAFRLGYGYLISLILVISIKSFHYKERPQKEEFTIFMEKVIASAFPSMHSILVTVLVLILALTYPLWWVIGLAILAAFSVYFQRYISKKHFVIDIVGGILIAVAVVIFVMKTF